MSDLTFQETTVAPDGSYQWSDTSNWNTGTVPASTGDNVTLPAGAYTSEDNLTDVSLGTLNIGDGVALDIDSGSTLATSTLQNSGAIDITGNFTVGNVNGTAGSVTIESGGVLDITNVQGDDYTILAGGTMVVAADGNINSNSPFNLQGGLLDLENQNGGASLGVNFSGSTAGHLELNTQLVQGHNNAGMANLGIGDSIEFENATVTAVSFDTSDDQLTITASGTDYTFNIASFESGTTFAMETDATTGQEAAVVICYLHGTRILTEAGYVAVETLAAGDLVQTFEGGLKAIRWIGRRDYSQYVATRRGSKSPIGLEPPEARFNASTTSGGRPGCPGSVLEAAELFFSDGAKHAAAKDALPVKIAAGALGEHLPSRDLLVSPCHAILVDGVLAQAGALINGASIVQIREIPEHFVYYHIELETHDLVLAEGIPAETFVDNVSRMGFDNWSERKDLADADALTGEMEYPRAKSARQVPAEIRARLSARAATIGLALQRLQAA